MKIDALKLEKSANDTYSTTYGSSAYRAFTDYWFNHHHIMFKETLGWRGVTLGHGHWIAL